MCDSQNSSENDVEAESERGKAIGIGIKLMILPCRELCVYVNV